MIDKDRLLATLSAILSEKYKVKVKVKDMLKEKKIFEGKMEDF